MSADELSLRVEVRHPGFTLSVSEALPLDGVTALFGPSGSGKSTLLRAIAGFERPASGRIACGESLWFDDQQRVDVPAHRRAVGYMFQDGRLFTHLDVAGNLRYPQRRRRDRQSGWDRDAVVAALDLEPLLERRVASLSGGERQRVALGRTLLSRPRLLLLDEPLAALDRNRKAEILPYLARLQRQFRLPTLFVSHDVDEVAQLADNVLVLAGGRVQTRGTTAAIVERLDLQPITGRFEAGVLVEGVVLDHDARLHLTHVDLAGDRLSMPLIAHVPPGERIRIRIRARDVSLATEVPRAISIRNILPGTLEALVTEPETGFAEALIGLRGTRIRARLTIAAVEDLALAPGAQVFALVKSVSFETGG
ncbi:MAG: molybdenum ABC transporter ATP-binding protein [Pseudomonadales bacterium]